MMEDGRGAVAKTKGNPDEPGDPGPKGEKDAAAGGQASELVDGGADRLPGVAGQQSAEGPPDSGSGGSGGPKGEREGEQGGEASDPVAADISVSPGSHGGG